MLSAIAGLALSFIAAAPAAATPEAPGSFTGHGFDTCVSPSQKVMDAWNLTSPFSVVGIYISGNSRYCGDQYQPHLSPAWVARNAANGWRFLPIHVGYQSPCFVNNPKSRVQKKKLPTDVKAAKKLGIYDANETIAALQKFGFPLGSTSFLDIEHYNRTTTCDNAVMAFIDGWTQRLHKKGYKSGLYSSGSAAIKLVDEAWAKKRPGFNFPDQMWNAWTNQKADVDGGPYLSNSAWKSERLHQYHNGINVKHGGYTVNIDKNFMRVGGGSRATPEVKPCGVPMTRAKYKALKRGTKAGQVKTIQCLLKQQGYKKKVTNKVGRGAVRSINKFRSSLGWKPTDRVTKPTWVALLAAGSQPRVLKYGSVGEEVWRLQRSLRAAGLKVKITGIFNAKTVKAVKKYRQKYKLPAYETVDAKVWSLLQRGKRA